MLQFPLVGTVSSCTQDASVRKALLSFFDWFIPRVPEVSTRISPAYSSAHGLSQDDLYPHAPVLLLFTTSALTHIFPEIRVDAVRFLDIFLEHIPELVVEGWASGSSTHGRRILDGYLGLLNAGTAFGGEGGEKSCKPCFPPLNGRARSNASHVYRKRSLIAQGQWYLNSGRTVKSIHSTSQNLRSFRLCPHFCGRR